MNPNPQRRTRAGRPGARPASRSRLLAASVSVSVLLCSCGPEARRPEGAQGSADVRSATNTADGGIPFDLYFPASSGALYAERRTLPAPLDPTERARALVAALLSGPEPTSPDLRPPLPEDVRVGSASLSPPPASILYLDLVAAQRPLPPPAGSADELLTVYSLVDTILLNVPEIRRVVLLWNGRQIESFSGHVDTARPLAARESLVRRVEVPLSAPAPAEDP